MSSTLYRVRETFPDAPSALTRARAIMRDLADLTSDPWPRLEPVTTGEQYAYALRSFDTARMVAYRKPGVVPFLDELWRRGVVTFDAQQPKSRFTADLRLGPDLADLWPLPESVTLSLNSKPPFGGPDSEPEDDCTEEELDRMVSVLGPLFMDVRWDCAWRGLPESKDCGVLLCLNRVWVPQHVESSPGEFGVWISFGPRVAWTPEGEAWRRDCGLPLGESEDGW
ncbi:hypothetical protein ACIRQQ_48980 [Streptomyces fuscichromogenes]|uniref:hypothetical protein n=1 Tax=Streptomyces fuscichromogenes TaxID=1324013 RepID=UPI003813DB03